MAFIKFESGVKLVWDETISVGELILTYHDGYHILERIEFRDLPEGYQDVHMEFSDKEAYPFSPLFHYVKVLKGDGTKSKALRSRCDASYCSRVSPELVKKQLDVEIEACTKKFNAIMTFL